MQDCFLEESYIELQRQLGKHWFGSSYLNVTNLQIIILEKNIYVSKLLKASNK